MSFCIMFLLLSDEKNTIGPVANEAVKQEGLGKENSWKGRQESPPVSDST